MKIMKTNIVNSCLCEYCVNIELKLKVLNRHAATPQLKSCQIEDKYSASRLTMCPKIDGAQYYQKKCIERNCTSCGVKAIGNHLHALVQSGCKLEWNRWVTQSYTNKKGEKKQRKMLELQSRSAEDFVDELSQELHSFPMHLHTAKWQHEQFTHIIKNVPQNWVVLCMDFGENYTNLHQDEAQSAHWSHQQTVFSAVAYHQCPHCEDSAHESLVFISDDFKHDTHAVQHFVNLATDHLRQTRGLTIERQIHFSDGAASQFKCKTSFSDASHSIADFGFPIEKNYFGSRHGKGPSDGEIGVVKRSASVAVASRSVESIRDAEEFFTFCQNTLKKDGQVGECHHQKRSFFHVKAGDINRDRPERINIIPIIQTRKVHSLKPLGDGRVATRNLSCFCGPCIIGNQDECENAAHVEKWTDRSLRPRTSHLTRGQPRGVRTRGGLARQCGSDRASVQMPKARTRGGLAQQCSRGKAVCRGGVPRGKAGGAGPRARGRRKAPMRRKVKARASRWCDDSSSDMDSSDENSSESDSEDELSTERSPAGPSLQLDNLQSSPTLVHSPQIASSPLVLLPEEEAAEVFFDVDSSLADSLLITL